MKTLLILPILFLVLVADEYKLRKYQNVKAFYSSIAKDTINLSIKYNTPPAVVLAIAGLESGYGSGYVARITGNILSLGANKSDIQLPALNLPYCKDDKIKRTLFDPNDQKKCKELIWKQRPKSLKKDYRPKNIAGKYFKYNPLEYKKAKLKNIEDFLTIWLNKNHKYEPFSKSKLWLEEQVRKNGIDILFDYETNIKFINKIGGVPNSFNYRKSWTKKVQYILDNAGLIDLSKKIYYKNNSFDKTW
jgi:hypothetical protein